MLLSSRNDQNHHSDQERLLQYNNALLPYKLRNRHNTPIGTSSSTHPSPSCTLDAAPAQFHLGTTHTGLLRFDPIANRLVSAQIPYNATTFHIRLTSDDSITGISQLALSLPSNATDSTLQTEYGAYVPTSNVPDSGSSVQFFANATTTSLSGYGIVAAGFSTYLCQLSVYTWMMHDLAYPEICGGEVRLGFGLSEVEGCESVALRVSAV